MMSLICSIHIFLQNPSPTHLHPIHSLILALRWCPVLPRNQLKLLKRSPRGPRKQLKTKSWNSPQTMEHKTMTRNAVIASSPTPSWSPDSHLIPFGNPDSSPAISNLFYGKVLEETEVYMWNQYFKNLLLLNILNNICLPLMCVKGTYEIQNCEGSRIKSASATSRTPVCVQDHVLAERKRCEKLSEHFIALSAVIPNLKEVQVLKAWKLLGVYD